MPLLERGLPRSFYTGYIGCLGHFRINGKALRLQEDALNRPDFSMCDTRWPKAHSIRMKQGNDSFFAACICERPYIVETWSIAVQPCTHSIVGTAISFHENHRLIALLLLSVMSLDDLDQFDLDIGLHETLVHYLSISRHWRDSFCIFQGTETTAKRWLHRQLATDIRGWNSNHCSF